MQHGAAPNAAAVQKLGQSLARNLADRSYDTRKAAAQEIEQRIRDAVKADRERLLSSAGSEGSAGGEAGEVEQLLSLLTQCYLLSPVANHRKGGLIALAASAIALESSALKGHLGRLIPPILDAFSDPDPRVRFYASEALYNVAKVARKDVLIYFNDIFDGLCKLFADVDVDVKNGAQYLDRLFKDIVTESPCLDVEAFVPLLSQRIKVLNPYVRQLMISWVNHLNSVADINILQLLPSYFEGLLAILSDSNRDVRHAADGVLSEFLRAIKARQFRICSPTPIPGPEDPPTEHEGSSTPPKPTPEEMERLTKLAELVVKGCESKETLCRLTALVWLSEMVDALGLTDPPSLRQSILTAILDCLDDPEEEIRRFAERTHEAFYGAVEASSDGKRFDNMTGMLLARLSQHEGRAVRAACLQWLSLLVEQAPDAVHDQAEDILDAVLSTLSRHNEPQVLVPALRLLSQLFVNDPSVPSEGGHMKREPSSSEEPPRFARVARKWLAFLAADAERVETQGRLMLRELCELLGPARLYRVIAETLADETDLEFSSALVHLLNWTLLTASVTRPLREQLLVERSASVAIRRPPATQQKKSGAKDEGRLFYCLLRAWCHNPAAALALCLWTEDFSLARKVVQRLALVEPSEEFLLQLDQLVSLFESPVFSRIRLQMLNVGSCDLIATIAGMAMLLPQTSAYQILHNRLLTVQTMLLATPPEERGTLRFAGGEKPISQEQDIQDEMLSLLDATIDRHRQTDAPQEQLMMPHPSSSRHA